MSASNASQGAKRPGRSPVRKAGLVVVVLLSVYLSGVSTYRIFSATLFPEPGTTLYSCREGAEALYRSVEQARARTAQMSKPEREALIAFRDQLNPTWSQANAVRSLCQKDGDQQALAALRSVELLRYAEERAVRYKAIDLTRWRERAPREVHALSTP